ncbi:MAG: hypothetical protein ACRC1H_16135, partial [Caldilineaceae bacterium]
DALKAISNGSANKVFLPYESSALLGALGGIQEVFKPQAPVVPSTNGTQGSATTGRGVHDGQGGLGVGHGTGSVAGATARPTTGGDTTSSLGSTTSA